MDKWDERFLRLSNEVATWSKDPSTKVGAVIARGKHLVSVGFNGFPKGMADDDELYDNREIKYERVIHGEVNAILNAQSPVTGCTLYCNRPCCSACSLAIVQSGITRVVCQYDPDPNFVARWGPSMLKSQSFFQEASVTCDWVTVI